MKKIHKWLIPTVLTTVFVGILPGCSDTSDASGANPASVPVKVIKLGQFTDPGLSGKIIPDQDIKIVSKVSGKVAGVNVQEGDKVKKGDVLVQLETDDLLQQVRQAQSGVAAAEAKLADTQAGARTQEIQGLESAVKMAQGAYEQATAALQQASAALDLSTKTYNRLRNMFDSSSSVTQEELDKGTLDYEKAKAGYEQAQAAQKSAAAQVEAAKAKLEQARIGPTDNTLKALQAEVDRLHAGLELANSSLNNATITAPIDGVVVKKSISPGEMAQAGVPIISLVNMDQVQVELSVADNQISKVNVGTPVQVKVQSIPDQLFQGTISFVSPVSNPNSNTFPVKVKVDNKDGLLFAGMVAEVHIDGAGDNRIEVPKSAIVKKENKEYLFIMDNDAARLVEVKTEEKNQDWVYVQPNDKLKGDRQIVVNPGDKLADGTKVKAQ
ncbi:efflux RND transporter periplasmic adaptor subunit [Paenibacillus naphthalenovorans]|uniref:Putative efflux pump membrane fusion protein n=1 Tax=Paenibacillus naphthalenovorans TaxID=162209 RepID=A0A0U2U279_9BACL|nr:efflux RND transporter periplasmic adaptor subunit [Paenibacillus naphthalenovorans]ALS20424.1 putative efflux pump membrane fusion protein [Paenibacillus naphthalenovorans]